jgi:uncharacterized protein YdhG (YjbR/CyaY superfamily)
MPKLATVEDYIAALPERVRPAAIELHQLIKTAAPNARDSIRYGMPAFSLGDKTFLYFACWKHHAGLYPVYRGDDAFEALIGPYRAKKDTVRFAYGETIPNALITAIVRAQIGRL